MEGLRIAALALGSFVLELTLGPQWAPWKTAAPIVMPAKLAGNYVRLTIEPDFDPTPDLRIVDESGTEVPYVSDPDTHRAATGTQRESPFTSADFLPGAFTQAVIDFGGSKTTHAAVLLDGGEDTFFHRVRVETSPDAKVWTLARKDAYVYRAPDKSANMIVSFPPTNARYVRLQILESRAKFPLAGWTVSNLPPERGDTFVPRQQRFADATPSNAPSKQVWSADFGRAVAGSAIEFLNLTAPFSRTVSVEAGPDGVNWHDVGSGSIFNGPSGAPQAAFAFAEQRARFWRVTIDNGKRGSLGDLAPRLMTRPHDLLFEPALNRTYVLLANNDAAAPPDYDLGAKMEREDWSADLATLGPAGVNPAFENARPILDRYPYLIYVAGAFGIAGLGLLVFRLLKPRPRPKDVFKPPVSPQVK
jgi:hypothetical protein